MRNILIGIIILLTGLNLQSQEDTTSLEINDGIIQYDAPRTYVLQGVKISGAKYLDHNILRSITGLIVGQQIEIPGEDISKAIKNLWRQGRRKNRRYRGHPTRNQ